MYINTYKNILLYIRQLQKVYGCTRPVRQNMNYWMIVDTTIPRPEIILLLHKVNQASPLAELTSSRWDSIDIVYTEPNVSNRDFGVSISHRNDEVRHDIIRYSHAMENEYCNQLMILEHDELQFS